MTGLDTGATDTDDVMGVAGITGIAGIAGFADMEGITGLGANWAGGVDTGRCDCVGNAAGGRREAEGGFEGIYG